MSETKTQQVAGLTALSQEHLDRAAGTEPWINPAGFPVIGWKGVPGMPRSFENSAQGFSLMWGIVLKNGEYLYEQPQIVENPGCIVVIESAGKFGFVQNSRNTSDRLLVPAGKNYVNTLIEEGRINELFAGLGETRWELPAGIAPAEGDPSSPEYFIKIAKAEALEEGGFEITDTRIVGELNTNPTFFPHAQKVVYGRVESMGDANPEDLEMIGKAKLFSPEEIRGLIASGQLNDGKSLAALAMAGVHIPF